MRPLIIAHRGASNLAPENTLASFRLAKELGCIVLCEGIETAEQLEWVRRSGADVVQGYYYYPPLPAEEFEKILGCAAIPGEFHVASV